MKPNELDIEFINTVIVNYWNGEGLHAQHNLNETALGLFDIFGIGVLHGGHGGRSCQYDFIDISKLEVINCTLLNISRDELHKKLNIVIEYSDPYGNDEED